MTTRTIDVALDPRFDADAYGAVPIAYEVREAFDARALAGRKDRRVMRVVPLATPYVKDYDALPHNAPADWSKRFDVSSWKSWGAFSDGKRVGSAALIPGDVGVLWDIRVATDARRSGVGAKLLAAIEEWAPKNGVHWLAVETQNVNVPAYAFYLKRDFTVTEVNAHAYAELPDEVQIVLHKKLPGPHRVPGEITTPRLVLRRRHPGEAAELKALVDANLEHLRAWMPWAMKEPTPIDVLTERLKKFESQFDQGLEWGFGIQLRESGKPIGAMGMHPRLGPTGLEIGYWLDKDETGKGYATEAAEALTRVALAQPGVTHVQIRHDPRNSASAGIPRRLGYRHILTIENETFAPDGSLRDTQVWETP